MNCSHKAQTVEDIQLDEHGTYSVRVRCDLCERAVTYLKCTPTAHRMGAAPGITVVECESDV